MIRWEQASYFPGQLGGSAFLIIPERIRAVVHSYPQPCPSRAPRGEQPILGDPEVVRQTYVVGWEKTRGPLCGLVRFRLLNMSTGEKILETFGSIRQAQEWAEERL